MLVGCRSSSAARYDVILVSPDVTSALFQRTFSPLLVGSEKKTEHLDDSV